MFSQAYIEYVDPPTYDGGGMTRLSWVSDAPPNTWYQVYINTDLIWYGLDETACEVPTPSLGETDRITIGTVDPGEETTNFSATFPPLALRRVSLAWLGGYWESMTLEGFFIYGSPAAGDAISYTTPLATITAYPQSIDTSGFGLGGFGEPGFGVAGGAYSWDSDTLANGTWSFAVVPFDAAGNTGSPQTTTAIVAAPPAEVPPFADGLTRLKYLLLAYGQTPFGDGGFGEPEVQLTWNASAG